MCRFASFVLTKGEEFWSDNSDSHETIIAEHNLHADGARGTNILRVEISPTDKIKVWPSLKAWAFNIDQDIMPEWFVAATAEKRTRAALARRFKDWKTGKPVKIGGSLDLSGTGITSLPDNLAVGGYLYLSGTGIKKVPLGCKRRVIR